MGHKTLELLPIQPKWFLIIICSIFDRFVFWRSENVFSEFTLHFSAPGMRIGQKIKE